MIEHPMSRRIVGVWIVCVIAFIALVWGPANTAAITSAGGEPFTQDAAAAKQKTASEAFKNIQVLKDISADRLLPSMRYLTVALGVRCDYCHDVEHYDSDDKAPKQTARKMMTMTFATNRDNFGGKREVTCYTCHRGASKPVGIPALPEIAAGTGAAVAAAPAAAQNPKPPSATSSGSAQASAATDATTSLPSADEIFAKYLQAIGGAEAVAKNTTRAEQGIVEGPRNPHATIETYRKAPDKAYAVLHTSNGDVFEGVDGKAGWGKRANGQVVDESGDELARSIQWAAFYPGEQFEEDYSRFQVRGTEKIEGHEAYEVMAWWPVGGVDRLYFDTRSGLLLRISHLIESPLGAVPLQTDYDDYRDVNGLKIPFKVRVARMDGTTTYTWQKMDANVPVDESRFAKPTENKAPEKPSK